MVATSSSTTASMVRIPNRCRASSSSTSRPVMITAQSSGIWNMRLRATALPSTSARSQAPMASSQNSQLGQRVQRGIPIAAALGQVLAGRPRPSRAEMTCMKMAIRLARPTTQSSPYLNWAPPCQIGAPVARVHVADADQNRRPDERPPLLPEAGLMVGHLYAAVHPFQRHGAGARNQRRLRPSPVLASVGVFLSSLIESDSFETMNQ